MSDPFSLCLCLYSLCFKLEDIIFPKWYFYYIYCENNETAQHKQITPLAAHFHASENGLAFKFLFYVFTN